MIPGYDQFAPESDSNACVYFGTADPFTVFSNKMTLFVTANNRPAEVSRVADEDDMKIIAEWRDALRAKEPRVYLRASTDDKSRASFPKEAGETILHAYEKMLGVLNAQFMELPNFGEHMKKLLLANGWTEKMVYFPCFGYSRPHLSIAGPGTAIGTQHTWLAPGLGHNFCSQTSLALQTIDAPRWSTNVIPKYESANRIEGISPLERPRGEMLRQRDLIAALAMLTLVYEPQALQLWVRANAPWMRLLAEITRARRQLPDDIKRANDDMMMAVDYLEALPRHDIIDMASNMFQDVEAVGHFGLKKALFNTCSGGLSNVVSEFKNTIFGSRAGTAGVTDLEVQALLGGVENGSAVAVDIIESYIDQLSQLPPHLTWKELATSEGWHDLRSVAMAFADSTLYSDMSPIVSQLQWGSLRTEPVRVDYFGADFTLTDGKLYTRPATQQLAGFSPTLGLNNQQAYPYSRTETETWARKKKDQTTRSGGWFEYSFVTVHGHLDDISGGMQYERHNLPVSAWLREEDVEPKWALGSNKESMRNVLNYWKSKATEYLREWYTPALAKSSEQEHYWMTPWDPMTVSNPDDESRKTAFAELTVNMNGQMVPVTEVQWRWSPSGFFMRIPVAISRTTELMYMYPNGLVFAKCTQKGNVIWTGNEGPEIVLSHETGALDALVDMEASVWSLPDVGGINKKLEFTFPQSKISPEPPVGKAPQIS